MRPGCGLLRKPREEENVCEEGGRELDGEKGLPLTELSAGVSGVSHTLSQLRPTLPSGAGGSSLAFQTRPWVSRDAK